MKVFSFCLYGSNKKYTFGMIENIKIINKCYSDWYIYIYYNNVPNDIIEMINGFKNVKMIASVYNGSMTMFDRFKPIDDKNVEIMIVRDADSRCHDRDQWSINEFINSDKKFHIIRDHIWHQTLILGGLWGIKQGLLQFNIEEAIQKYVKHCVNTIGEDQYFLSAIIYPQITNNVLIHGTLRMNINETIIPFQFPIINNDFCGQVIDYRDNIEYRVFNLNGFA